MCNIDGEAERLGKLSLRDAVDAVHEEGLVSEETDYEDGELQEGVARWSMGACPHITHNLLCTSVQVNDGNMEADQARMCKAPLLVSCTTGYESEEEEEEEAEDKGEKPAPESRPARKVLEPYEVPMSGAFWMHDDRGGDDEEAGEG